MTILILKIVNLKTILRLLFVMFLKLKKQYVKNVDFTSYL